MSGLDLFAHGVLKVGIDKNGAAIYRKVSSGSTYQEYKGRDWWGEPKRRAAL